MATSETRSFGRTVRVLREGEGFGLRRFAKIVGVSATYLSKIERGEFAPPAEDKVRVIAKALRQDPDELLALAGRIPNDLMPVILARFRENPRTFRTLITALD